MVHAQNNHSHEVEKKGKNESEIAGEMMPFVVYAAIPLFITIVIALMYGPPY
ncbi:MAG: hypothetical protein JNL11_13985 [Bdellovibrionaceae bacterium]|nr:hypothetical protein [Pseudobdellovibrionaceae bacterium]